MKKPDEKRQRPGLQRGFDSLTQEDDTAKVAQVIKRLTGKQEPFPPAPEPSSLSAPPLVIPAPPEKEEPEEVTGTKNTTVKISAVKITPVTIKADYYKVPNEVSDVLVSLQTPAEQAVYHRLFRLSYGYGQNGCRVGMQALAKATNISSKKTIAKAIDGLITKRHIAILQGAQNDVRGTWYRVFLPEEIEEVKQLAGAISTAVKSTAVKNSAVHFPTEEVKNTAVENTTVAETGFNTATEPSGAKNTAVNFTPSTYIHNVHTLSLAEIVNRFYELVNQKPSQKKRERGMKEGEKLLQEGFALEDLAYTVSWVIQRYPDTGSFDRIAFFIDQALKDRYAEQQTLENEQRRQTEQQRQQEEQQQIEEKKQQIEKVKASLSKEELENLRQEATQLVEQEHGRIEFGHEILIRLKVEELIGARYVMR